MRKGAGIDADKGIAQLLAQYLGIGPEAAANAGPAAAGDCRQLLWLAEGGFHPTNPAFGQTFVGGAEHLPHAGIEAGVNLVVATGFGQRQQRNDAQQRQPAGISQTLCNAAADAQAGKRARPTAISNRIQLRQA